MRGVGILHTFHERTDLRLADLLSVSRLCKSDSVPPNQL